MPQSTGLSPHDAEPAGQARPLAQLNGEFMRALQALKAAGEGDLACKMAARGWALLFGDHPLEALRLEKLLHRLALNPPVRKDPAMPNVTLPLEVRHLPPAQRHALIFETLTMLGLGQAIELINDHDPKPLRYQFDAETPGQFSFTYLEAGPEVWRVEIRRIAGAGTRQSGAV